MPIETEVSAILKTYHSQQDPILICKKSMTLPAINLSIKLPNAPAMIKDSPILIVK